jgi:hypothetical protein
MTNKVLHLLALLLSVAAVAAGFFFAISATGLLSERSLDKAQAAFEGSADWPTREDFDGWRASGTLRCRDIPSLRICEASWPMFSPTDGKPFGKDRVTFACSTEICAWVDP